MANPKLIAQLTRQEGKPNRPYRDTTGHWTVGVGRNLDAVPFSEDEIALMLANDVIRAEDSCRHNLPWFPALDEVRQAALVNMCFNLGWAKLAGFERFLDAMKRSEWLRAANEMMDSTWASQVGKRAVELAAQIKTGEWQ